VSRASARRAARVRSAQVRSIHEAEAQARVRAVLLDRAAERDQRQPAGGV